MSDRFSALALRQMKMHPAFNSRLINWAADRIQTLEWAESHIETLEKENAKLRELLGQARFFPVNNFPVTDWDEWCANVDATKETSEDE